MGEQVEMAFAKHQQLQASTPSVPTPPREGTMPSLAARFTWNEAKLWKMELSVRIGTIICALAGLSFLATDKQSRSFTVFQSVITQEARMTDMKALVFSVISLGIAAGYSVLQTIYCVTRRSSCWPAPFLGWGIFVLDQVMAYLVLTSSSASAQAAYLAEQGNDGFQWNKICYLYEHFCQQVGAGIISSFLAFIGLALASLISAFNLFASSSFDE